MAYDNDMEFIDRFLLPHHEKIYDFFRQCGRPYELDSLEKAIVEFVFWARNKNIGRGGAIHHQFYPGPHGIKTKKGWYPDPEECCDASLMFYYNESTPTPSGSYPYKYDPWVWWKHCKSLKHIEYVVKNRFGVLLQDYMKSGNHIAAIKFLISLIEKNEFGTMGAYVSSGEKDRWLVDEYLSDVSSGKFIRPYAEIKPQSSRYDILKRSV